MCRLGVMGERHGEGGGGRPAGGAGGGDDSVSESPASSDSGVSSGSLCSSTVSSLTENDDAESSPAAGDCVWLREGTMQLDGDGGGPLYELSPLLAHLPVRTGLSKYYEGKSQAFTSLSDVKCLQDLAKKATPHTSRINASRLSTLHHILGPCSKKIAKKTSLRSSSDGLLSRARSKGLLATAQKRETTCTPEQERTVQYIC